MRIAFACPYDWQTPGGVQVHVRQLAAHLHERGHQVLVLTPGRAAPDEPWVRVVGRPVRVRYNRSVAPICISAGSLGEIRRGLSGFRPDVVNAHEPLVPSTSMLATLASRAPVVGTFHAYGERSLLFDLAAPALWRIARRLHARVAVSQAAAGFASSRIGGRFEVVPNGAEVERFRDARPLGLPEGRRVLFVGRLDPRKGFRVALDAFGILVPEDPRVRLVVAGDGPDREAAADLRRDVRDRVMMLGSVSQEDLPSCYAAADVFVAPSLGGESFGIVLVEAMAAGLPIVASDIPGYREVVRDGSEGLLTPAGDAAALAAGIRRVLGDPPLARRLGDAGRDRSALFSWESVADRLEPIYERAAASRPR